MKQQRQQGLDEVCMNARSAKKKRPIKRKDLTTSTQLWKRVSDFVDGMPTVADCIVDKTVFKSSVPNVTELKQPLNEKKGLKHDDEKPSLAYIPKAALWHEGKAFKYGAKKYEAWNYKNGINISRTLSAALRHIAQFLDGENVDEESGVHHLGCARANIAMAIDTLEHHPEFDDRFKKGKKKK